MRAAVVALAAIVVVLTASIARAGPTARAAAPELPPPTTTTTIPPVTATLTMAGCPPPPAPPPPAATPWHPSVLVPESSLPPDPVVAPWASQLDAISGKGMWIWEWEDTDGGNAAAIVQQASEAGLHQIWLRVADSRYGFYGASELAAIVDRAHAAGLSVIAWGFPYLYDPLADARWTEQVLNWRSAAGASVDGFSADLETAGEGVAMDERRASVYLGTVRSAVGSRLVVATVFPPFDSYWNGSYPYRAMARYVDAFAPMEYWECVDPGQDAVQALQRLAPLRPVHLIGQAFGMGDVGGRIPAPAADEITRFLLVGQRGGAVGASLWVWQDADPAEWSALSAYAW